MINLGDRVYIKNAIWRGAGEVIDSTKEEDTIQYLVRFDRRWADFPARSGNEIRHKRELWLPTHDLAKNQTYLSAMGTGGDRTLGQLVEGKRAIVSVNPSDDEGRNLSGRSGRILALVRPNSVLFEFDDNINGHDGDTGGISVTGVRVNGKNGHCWYIDLELIRVTEIVELKGKIQKEIIVPNDFRIEELRGQKAKLVAQFSYLKQSFGAFQFDKDLTHLGGHSCDGLAPQGHCLTFAGEALDELVRGGSGGK